MQKPIQDCQETVTLLGMLSGALPIPDGRQIEHEVESLRYLVEFFGNVARSERDACASYFSDEVLEQARPWVQKAYMDECTANELVPDEIRCFLRFVVMPKTVHKLCDLLDTTITRETIMQYSEEELGLRGDLCEVLLSYIDQHHLQFA